VPAVACAAAARRSPPPLLHAGSCAGPRSPRRRRARRGGGRRRFLDRPAGRDARGGARARVPERACGTVADPRRCRRARLPQRRWTHAIAHSRALLPPCVAVCGAAGGSGSARFCSTRKTNNPKAKKPSW